MPVCFILNIRTGILNACGGGVRFDEYPYQYSGRLRKSGGVRFGEYPYQYPERLRRGDGGGRSFRWIPVSISRTPPEGRWRGSFILVNIRTGILNAPGGFRA